MGEPLFGAALFFACGWRGREVGLHWRAVACTVLGSCGLLLKSGGPSRIRINTTAALQIRRRLGGYGYGLGAGCFCQRARLVVFVFQGGAYEGCKKRVRLKRFGF